MILNLIAALVALSAVVLGVTMLSRSLLAAPLVTQVRCARCGRRGEELTSFTCPGCGFDVRDTGLVAEVRNSPLARFWHSSAWTLAVMLVAMGTSDALSRLFPGVQYSQAKTELVPREQRAVEMFEIDGAFARRGDLVSGRISADLTAASGRITTLQIDLPSRDCRVIDEYAAQRYRGTLDETMIRQWFAIAGISDADSELPASLYSEIERMLPAKDPLIRSDGRFLTPFLSSGRSSSSGLEPPRWFRPVLLIVWSCVWLAGLALLLRRRKRAATTEAAP